MTLISQRDFETKAGQERLVKKIHQVEVQVNELKEKIKKLERLEKAIERDLEGPEAY